MAAFDVETVTEITHWTDRLFSFRTTRDKSFRFENGQFVMIGLKPRERPARASRSPAPIRSPRPTSRTSSSSIRSRFPTVR